MPLSTEPSRHICDKKFGMSFTSVRCLGESNMGIVFLVLFWYPVHEPAALEKTTSQLWVIALLALGMHV